MHHNVLWLDLWDADLLWDSNVPVVLSAWSLIDVKEGLDQLEAELVIVWLILELEAEDLLDERQEALTFLTLTDGCRCEGVLEVLDSGELSMFPALGFFTFIIVSPEEGKVAINEVEHEVAEGDKVVSSAVSDHVEGVHGGEDQVTLEELLFLGWNVLTVLLKVLLGETEVDKPDLVEGSLRVGQGLVVTDEDVVKLEVVESVASFVDHPEGIKELETNLEHGLLGERLISLEEVVFHGITKLLLDEVGPDLVFHGGVTGFLLVVDGAVADDDFAFAVGSGVEWVLSPLLLGEAGDILEGSVLAVVHFMVLAELDDDWPVDAMGV